MSVPMTSDDKSSVTIVAVIAAGIVMVTGLCVIGSNVDEWAPKRIHYVVPNEYRPAAAAFAIELRGNTSYMADAVRYSKYIFGNCCSCDSELSHSDNDYLQRAMTILEEDTALKTTYMILPEPKTAVLTGFVCDNPCCN